jgi:hypothetical protein
MRASRTLVVKASYNAADLMQLRREPGDGRTTALAA